MHDQNVKVKLLPGAHKPEYQTKGSAGADLRALKRHVLWPGDHCTISTGVFLEVPEGFECQIRPRSGLAAKYAVTVLNAPGTIDSDYRGEIKVILMNHGREAFVVNTGDRIAQAVFARVERFEFLDDEELTPTSRGSGGFGSTGM